MKNKNNLFDKKRQQVWIANRWGGEQRYLDELVPEGKVYLWEKLVVLGVISIIIFLFFLMLYFLIF
jgi:hypothetical protein